MKKHTAFLLDASRELLSDVRKLIEFRKTKRKKFELPEEEQAHAPSIKQGKKGLKGITLPPPTGFETPKMPKDRKSESKVSMRKTPPTTPKSSDETQKQSEMSVDAKRSTSLIAVKKKQSKGKLDREKLLRELEAKERAEKIFRRQQRKLRRQRIREFKKLRTASRFRSLRKIFCFTEPQRKVIRQILISEHVLSTVQPPSLNYSLVTLIDDTVDHRINWIKEKVFNFFNIDYNSAFFKMWNRKDGKYKRMIGNLVFSQFNQNMENVVLFFYETKYEQTRYKIVSVEYETNIEEELVRGTITSYHKEEPSTSNLSEEKPEPQITAQPQERSEGIVKKKSFRGKKPKVIITKAYIPVKYKRIIPQLHVVTINQICSFVNRGMLYNQDFFYVLRKPFPRVPYCDTYEEAHAQMPKYFHTGNFKISQVSCQFFVFVNIIQQYLNLNLKEPMFRFETTEFLQKDLRRLTGLTECRLTDRLLWSHCYSGNLLFRRYIYEKNNWPLKFGKPIEGNHQSNRIIDGGSLPLEDKKIVSEKFMSDLYKYIVSNKLPKEKVPYKAILYELGKGKVGSQITGTLKRQKNCSPYETTSDERLRCSYIDRQMSVLHSRTEWCYKVLQRGTSFHFNVRNYLEKHENLESLFNDKNFISKLNKFKECRKYLKHLKSYVTAEIPKHKLGVFALFRYWKKRELLVYPFLLRIESPSFQFVLRIVSLTQPEEANSFMEDTVFLRRFYHRARMHCVSLKGAVTICQRIYNSTSIEYTAELLYEFMRFTRIMWVASLYVNKSENFFEFMSRVQHVIIERTKQILEINNFLSMPPLKAQKTAVQVIYLMRTWRDVFFEFFDLNELDCAALYTTLKVTEFGLLVNINNMAKMAYDLFYLAKHFKHYTNLFDRRLSNIVIDDYKVNVWNLTCSNSTHDLRTTNYDIFDFANDKRWDNILRIWYQSLPLLEKRSKLLIDDLFKNLRDPISATKYLLSIKSNETSKSLHAHLMSKFKYCAIKFIEEVIDCVVETRDVTMDYTKTAYRNQPESSAIIIWLETLMEYIFREFRYVVTVNEMWKKADTKVMKKVYLKFLDFYHIHQGMKLTAFMEYRLQSDFWESKYASTGNVDIAYAGPDELTHHYCEQVTPYFGKFLSYRETVTNKRIVLPKRRTVFRQDVRFEWFKNIEPTVKHIAKSGQGRNDKMPQELKDYFDYIKAVKHAKDKKLKSTVDKFITSYYDELSKSTNQLVRRVHLKYTMYDIFLHTGKISSSYIPLKTIKHNVSMTKNFIVSNNGQYIFYASSFKNPDLTEETEVQKTSSLRQKKRHHKPSAGALASKYLDVAKLVTNDTLETDQLILPKLSGKNEIQMRYLPQVKYSFLAKFNMWQNQDLKHIIEKGIGYVQFNFHRELIMLAFIRELINKRDLKIILSKVETYKENKSLMPIIGNNKCELSPFYEFVIISAIYMSLNKKQIRFLETMFLVFQNLFYKERAFNKIYHSYELSQYECESMSPCDSSLSSLDFNYASEIEHFSYDNAYFDECEQNYDSDNIFGSLVTLSDFIYFLNGTFIDCDTFLENTTIRRCRRKINVFLAKPGGRNFLDKCLLPRIDDELDEECDLLVDFVFENYLNIMHKHKTKSLKKAHDNVEDRTLATKQRSQPGESLSVYPGFDEIYRVDSLLSVLFGDREEEEEEEEPEDDRPIERPLLTSIRKSSIQIAEVSQKVKKGSSDDLSEYSSASQGLSDASEIDVDGEAEPVEPDGQDEIEAGADKQEIELPDLEYKPSDVDKKEDFKKLESEKGRILKPSKMFYVDNIEESFRCYGSFFPELQSREYLFISGHSDSKDDIKPDADIHRPLETFKDSPKRKITKEEDKLIEKASESCSRLKSCGKIRTPHLWPVKDFMRLHLRHLRPLRLPARTVNMITKVPFIRQRFVKPSKVQRLFMFCKQDSKHVPKQRASINFLGVKPLPYYEAQKFYRKMAEQCFRRYAKYPALSSTNRHIERLFSSYAAFVLRKYSKNNEVAQCMQSFWNNKPTKRNKFIAWKFSYFQNEIPMFEEIKTLLPKIKNESLRQLFQKIIKKLRVKWDGHKFIKYTDDEDILELSWRDILLKYPILYRGITSSVQKAISTSIDKNEPPNFTVISTRVPSDCEEKCVDVLQYDETTTNNNRDDSSDQCVRPQMESSFEQERTNNANDICKILANPKLAGENSIPGPVSSWSLIADFDDTENSNLTMEELDNKFKIIMQNRRNYRKKCRISFKPGRAFYELVFNSKNFLESRCLNDGSVRFICNDYPFFVEKIHKFLRLISCYNNFVMQLNEEESYFFRDLTALLTFYLYQNVKSYLRVRLLATEAQKFIETAIPASTVGTLRQLRETSNLVIQKYLKIKTFNWFEPPKYSEPLKSYFKSTMMNRKFTQGKLMRTVNSASYHFRVLDYLVANNCPGHNDNPRLFMYFENFEMMRISSSIRNINRNTIYFEKFLSSKRYSKPILRLMFRGKTLTYDVPLKEIGDLLFSLWVDYVKRYKYIPRWKTGTCEDVESVKIISKNLVHTYSVYDEWLRMEEVQETLLRGMMMIEKSTEALAAYRDRWSLFTKVWGTKRKSTIKYMFLHKNFDLVEITYALNFFVRHIHMLKGTKDYTDVMGFRVDIKDVLTSLISRFEKFTATVASQVRQRLVNFCHNFKKDLYKIMENFSTKDDFTKLLTVVQATKRYKELKYYLKSGLCYVEKSRILVARFGLKFGNELKMMIFDLKRHFDFVGLYIRRREKELKTNVCHYSYLKVLLYNSRHFRAKCETFATKYWFQGPRTCSLNLDFGLELVRRYKKAFKTLVKEKAEINKSEKLLNCRLSAFPLFDAVYEDFKIQKVLYKFYELFKEDFKIWKNQYWASFNSAKVEERLSNTIAAFRALPLELRNLSVAGSIRKLLTDIYVSLPLFAKLKNKALKARHWKQLRRRTEYPYFNYKYPQLRMEKFFKWKLYKYSEIIDEILDFAVNESMVKQKLINISSALGELVLQIVPYYNERTYRGVALDTNDEVLIAIDDYTLELQSLTSSPYSAPFLTNIHRWEVILMIVHDVLMEWLSVQRKWKYLESVFISGDLRNQLPNMAKKFDDVDKTYLLMTSTLTRQRKVVSQCLKPDTFNKFLKLSEILDDCQKTLVNYLDTKRNSFPRFYFISNDELLSILAAQSPEGIQDQMFKIFDNVCLLRFRPQKSRNIRKRIVSGLVSCEKEVLNFLNLRSTNAAIEKWLTGIVNEMRKSLKLLTKESIVMYGHVYHSRIEWMFNTLGVIVMAANKTYWTANVELAFQRFKRRYNKAMKDLFDMLKEQINKIVLRVRGKLAKNDRKKLNTVLIVDVHSKDIVGKLVSESITKRTSFEWECQLRYYWKSRHQSLRLRQCSGFFQFGYEYMGLNGRLVITPLTDRIFLTITQALALKLGGAPAGPAGTGKTETTKDLAKAMGRLCMVTNCGENMDYIQFGKILMGLCQSGAWGCFDEFNRIDISVLSVITTQMQIIREALLNESVNFFKFEGYKIYLDRKHGVFITMNPGYAGRTELPETIKALFRPVVCIVPDLEHICLIMLFSEGFLTAKILAKKMTLLYSLSKDRLSKQSHYDFGLRSLKPVLTVAGDLKRNSPELDEEVVIMRALRDMNQPKLVPEDEGLFLELIDDLFPGIQCERVTYPDFNAAVNGALSKMDYILISGQINKVVQMYETLMTRHSAAIVGPTRGGKSVIISTLCEAQNLMNLPTMIVVLNPKAFTVDELYGLLDPKTRDWIDGLLSNVFREMNQPIKKPERRYIMFDGDVDALWIENMNSVMDDNKILTLTSGERMRLLDHCALLFEVGDLRYASPATVSRCGVVFVDSEIVGYKPYWERWLYRRHDDEEISLLSDLFETFIPSTLSIIFKGSLIQKTKPLSFIIPQNEVNLVSQLCYVLESTLPKAQKQRPSMVPEAAESEPHPLDESKAIQDVSEQKSQVPSKTVPKKGAEMATATQSVYSSFADYLYPRTDVSKLLKMNALYRKPPQITEDYLSYKIHLLLASDYNLIQPYNKYATRGRLKLEKNIAESESDEDYYHFQCLKYKTPVFKYRKQSLPIHDLFESCSLSFKKQANAVLSRLCHNKLFLDSLCKSVERSYDEEDDICVKDPLRVRFLSKWRLFPRVKKLTYGLNKILSSSEREFYEFCRNIFFSKGGCMRDMAQKDFWRLMKKDALENIVGDFNKLMRKKYSVNVNCKLGDSVLKHYRRIIQNGQKGKHFSAKRFSKKNDIQSIKEIQISQHQSVMKMHTRKATFRESKPSTQLFKLKKKNFMEDSSIDMLPGNKIVTDWLGNYWNENLYRLENTTLENKINDNSHSEPAQNRLKMYKLTISDLINYNKRLVHETTSKLQNTEKEDKAINNVNQLMVGEESESDSSATLPETYALRKLSFQYRNIMLKIKSETSSVNVEVRKRLSIEKKRVSESKEVVTSEPEFKSFTSRSMFAPKLKETETVRRTFIDPLEQEKKKQFQKLRSIFIEAMYASIGATLVERDRSKFDNMIKKIMNIPEYPDTATTPALFDFIPCRMPHLYNYKTDVEKQCWVAWSDILKPYVHDKNKYFDEIFVPTEESSRIGRLLKLMQSVHRPVILVGESGTAKTAIMMEFLRNVSYDYVKLTLTFSSRTTSLDVQRNIETSLDKINKHTLGPPAGKEMIIFIDDLNMPTFDEYGTQQPIALLKLTVEKSGLFDREGDLSWKGLQNVMFIGAMGMTARSDQVVDPRFTSHFSVFNLTPPSDSTINRIYISILNGHTDDFLCDIHSLTPDIMKATLSIYKFLREEIPPSPIRFHYIFSLRDLSRVAAGLLQTTPNLFKTKKEFIRVWRNEIMRVFYDRLCLAEDQTKVYDYIEDVIDDVFPTMRRFVRNNPLIFGDYENFMNPDEPRFYKDLENYDVIYKIFAEILEDYNAHFSGMDLVLFEDALDHLTRIHRVLRLHRGNLLAIGVGGCGKRSLITLASYAAGCKMYSINLCKGYNESFFKEDLKKLYVMLGADRVKSTFFFTSSHIVQEDFLEYINSILTVGFIPSLFSDEDKDAIINKVRKNARAAGCGRTKGEVWNFFLDTCKNHLHMVLSMSPLGNVLRVRCRSIPSLVNNSTIDWIFPWPTAALNAVANRFLSGELIPANQRKLVIQHIVFTHKSTVHFADEFLARYNRTCFITPKHYLDFIKLYVKFVKEKSADNIARSHEYELGLQKMVEAYITVEKISAETLKQKEIVERQNIACEILLKDLTAATSVTTEKQSIAKTKSKEIQIQSVEIDKNKKEAEEALSTALPALNEAKIALDQLNKNDITEIRSFATPPVPVQIVCECVLILSGYTEIDWKNAKGMMADPNFLNTLKNMNVNKITKAQQKKVREHLAKSTKMEQMATISKAGYGLLMFVRAVLNYCVVYRIVKPKQERVEMLEKKFAKALEILEALNEEVRQLEKILADLNEKYSTAMKEKHRIQEEMELMLYRLAIANKLLHGLSSENERWKKEHANLKEEYEKIIGNCLITSSFLAYTGAFNWELRQEMMYDTWRKHINKLKIPFSSRYKLELELMDEMAISKLYTEGLPPDELSLQNALLVLCSSRFALCIDPQQQALRWLMKREKDFQPKILSFDDNNFLTVLEASIRIGTPVIFKDVEYVDSIIENLLEKNIKGKRGQKVVLIGNKEVEYHDNFRLYLVSKLPNPQFESWIYTKSTVVNCIVTIIGLEDQLLNVVARHERPDLEEARERLIEQTNLTKQSVKFFEKTLLIELANAKGNLLDNTVLIQTLESTKVRVTEMQKELHEAEENKAGFEVTRNEYRPVAKRGALLYFVLYDMASMNAMYIYSLDSYLKVFVDSLSRPVISIIISARVKKFIAILTKKVYDYGCNGLFERDKLLFSFQIALRLQQSLGLVSEEEFTFLIKGDSSLDKCKKSCPAKWFPAERWKDLVKLNADFSAFGDILIEFENNISDWEKWYNLAAPEKGKMPYEKYGALKPFEKLMLFRCLRVDRISECIPDYINSIMGPYFNKPPLISLEQIVSTSSPHEPVMFVLCPGANPIPKLVKCAEKQRSGALGTADLKILTISLGQGQEPRATKMFFDGRRKGYWVIFENCHLLPFFIAAIEKTREKQEKPPHPGFRLWFTTEPTEKFPLSVLQSTTRVVLEIAESFKLNLARTVKSIDKVDFREQVRIHPSFGHIIYVLAFFHAVLLERKKFGQVGFNVNYDFSECDFESCYQLIKKYLKKKSHNMRKSQKPGYDINAYNQYLYDRVPWEILRYLIGEIVYGGRVIDYYDRRTVSTYLEEYMDNFIYQSLTTFCFFKRMSLKYPVPLYNNLNLYNKQIRHLPDTTFPGVFGLHPNVEIAYNDAKTTKFWKNLMSLQPAEGSVSKAGSKKESLVSQIGKKITDIVPKSLYDVQKEKMRYEDYIQTLEVVSVTKVLRDPTVIILFQELAMFNVLIQSLIRSLDNLAKAIRGEIAMDALLENIFDCLYEGEIPISWKKLIPQTKKSLGQWMTHFKNRIIQYDDWLKEFKTSAIWLSGLHVPQAYLTAVMQRTTRLQGWSLDQTALYSFITKMRTDKKIKAVPQLGCYIKDLFIQGARWDCHMHALQPPRRKIQVELLPILAIRPIKVDQRKFVKSFQTPVYTTTDRRNAMGVGFVFEADIQTNSHYSVWVMKGVCMLLNKE